MALTRPALAATALLCLVLTSGAHAASLRTSPQIVVYRAGVADTPAQTRKRERDLGFSARQRYRHALHGFAARLTDAQAEQLRRDPEVAQVVPDRPVSVDGSVVSGELVPPGITRVHAAGAGQVRGASGTAVAVIDTGVDLENSELNVVAGTNCIDPGQPPADDSGHGTHVAGIIGARNTGSGVVGVAPGTKIYAVKVLPGSGTGSTSGVICGLDWLAANADALGIRVANMSLSGLGPTGACDDDPEHAAVCAVTEAGVTTVAAAGNESAAMSGGGVGHVPAAFPEVLAVTAMIDTDGLPGGLGAPCGGAADDSYAQFSDYGGGADAGHLIAAPGGCVTSTKAGGGLLTMSGTSMAAPHVAAAAALCIDDGGAPGPCAGMTPADVIQTRRATAADGASLADGFSGDPLHPVGNRIYGNLVRSGVPPTASTGAVSAIGDDVATLSGSVDTGGADGNWWFELTSESDGTEIDTPAVAGDGGAIQATASGLDPGTTYHYRAVVRLDGWTIRGASASFTTTGTPPPPAPDTLIDSAPAGLVTTSHVSVRFSASPSPAVGFECRLDGAGWSACESPFEADVADGNHNLLVRALGAYAKRDQTPAAVAWTVDTTPPDTTLGARPSATTEQRDAVFGLGASEAGSFECRIDGGPWSACDASVRYTALAYGPHRFEARARDRAGLTDATPAEWEWTIVTPPAALPGPAPEAREPAPQPVFFSPPPVAVMPEFGIASTVGRARIDRSGRLLTVRVACHRSARCAGRVELRSAGRRISVARLSLAPGRRATLRFKVSRRARIGRTVALAPVAGAPLLIDRAVIRYTRAQ